MDCMKYLSVGGDAVVGELVFKLLKALSHLLLVLLPVEPFDIFRVSVAPPPTPPC